MCYNEIVFYILEVFMNVKKLLGTSFIGGCALSSVISCSSFAQEGSASEFKRMSDSYLLRFIQRTQHKFMDCTFSIFGEGKFNDALKLKFRASLEELVKLSYYLYDDDNIGMRSRQFRDNLDRLEREFSSRMRRSQVLPDWLIFYLFYADPGVVITYEVPKGGRGALNLFAEELKEKMRKVVKRYRR